MTMESEAMRAATFPRSRRSLKIFSDFNTLQFASVMAMVAFVLLLLFMTNTTPHGGNSVDLSKVSHPIAMPDADREDAMKITITRDGQVYCRRDRVNPVDLP